jgi:hypothetical protein
MRVELFKHNGLEKNNHHDIETGYIVFRIIGDFVKVLGR